MFLRRIPQSFRIARVAPNSPFTRRSSQLLARSFISSILQHPGQLSLVNDGSTPSNSTSIAPERTHTTAYTGHGQVSNANTELLANTLSSIQDFEAALEVALSQKHFEAADVVVGQLVDLYRSESATRLTLFHDLLRKEDADHLSQSTILQVLQLLRSSPYEAMCVPSETFGRIYRQRAHDAPILHVLIDVLKLQLEDIQTPTGRLSPQYQPPAIVPEALNILQTLIVKDQDLALDVFNALVEKNFIPPGVLEDPTLLESHDVQLVMYAGLAHASLHWEWFPLVTDSITHLLQTSSSRQPQVTQLVNDMVTALLDGETTAASATSLQACLGIIRAHRVPDNLVRSFYESAREIGCASEVVELYQFTRSERLTGQHPYPPPRGYALGWLMELLYEKGQHHLCRTLAREVLHDHLNLQVHYRPSFIAATVFAGEVAVARDLWKRYVSKDDYYVLLRDHRLMLAMVQAVATCLQDAKVELDATTALRKKVENKEHEFSLSEAETVARAAVTDWDDFLTRIVRDFEVDVWNDFDGATSETLTCYVRVLFTVGRFKDGLQCLRTLVERTESDSYQENIALCLNTAAEKNPRMVTALITSFAKRRVTVDPATFMAVLKKVLKEAEDRGDTELVDQVVLIARQLVPAESAAS
ncbi:hypothetical protein DFP72DRAFT_891371 [Ephemerocybe angulata]|uniref:Uncharacterized protein n=1 Tax=Ephemerocybe angulata TaxID=980116 RepID=A0A8H6I2C6_9AGAR|nr:hypothetical protein DFP72DRAFT_891371 [Tulosesus angulatus]